MLNVLNDISITSARLENVQLIEAGKVSGEYHFEVSFPSESELSNPAVIEAAVTSMNANIAEKLKSTSLIDFHNMTERLKYAEAIVELGYSQNAAALEAERLENRRIAMEERRQQLYRLWSLNRYPLGSQPVFEPELIGSEIDLEKDASAIPIPFTPNRVAFPPIN